MSGDVNGIWSKILDSNDVVGRAPAAFLQVSTTNANLILVHVSLHPSLSINRNVIQCNTT